MKYHIWTEGCQMNVADSQRVASALEHLGYENTAAPEEADIIVLNTCVVRQSAEDKATGRLLTLQPLKQKNPNLIINLMGCLVGTKENKKLKERFPFVDVFSPPSDPSPLITLLAQKEGRQLEESETVTRFAWMDGDLRLPRKSGENSFPHISRLCTVAHTPVPTASSLTAAAWSNLARWKKFWRRLAH